MKILIVLLIASLFSCSDHHKHSELLVIDLDNIPTKPLDISTIADSIAYIQLDNSFVLPGFTQLHWADSCFFANTREGVLKYDTKGHFLCKIGDIGDGPKEYPRYYYRFMMDKANQVIYIYSYIHAELLSYSFAGEFITGVNVRLPDDIKKRHPSFAYLQGDLIYFYYNNNCGAVGNKPLYWVSIKKDGALNECYYGTKRVAERDDGIYGISYSAMNDSTVTFFDLFEDTIYHVSPLQTHPAYLWGKGNFRLTEEDPFYAPPRERRICSHFFDTRNFFLFHVSNLNRMPDHVDYFVFYNKKRGLFSKLQKEDLRFDKRIDTPLLPQSIALINGREYFICMTNTAALLNIPEAIPWGMDADDTEGNPVVVLIRLKEQLK